MQDQRDIEFPLDDPDTTLASLTRRLVDGETRIEAALARGEDVSAWEEFWLKLLQEYEALHDRINQPTVEEHAGIAA